VAALPAPAPAPAPAPPRGLAVTATLPAPAARAVSPAATVAAAASAAAAARAAAADPDGGTSSRRPQRALDFAARQRRYVALELLYLGHDYDGFARQASTAATIEEHLFAALRKTRLVPAGAGWQELRYSRGGRTDKGVSALGQVVALLLRSSGAAGDGAPPAPADELDYPAMLNRVLPADIRVIGWADAPPDFSARFSASFREYKYFLVARPGALDLPAMRAAAAHLVGDHDFRHFCKPDVTAVRNFRRRVLEVRLAPVEGLGWGGREVLELYVRGTAFLWHQVRCLVAVLAMVGRGDEAPGVVAEMLDVDAWRAKPSYLLASDEPLLLYGCAYAPGLDFRRTAEGRATVAAALERALESHLVRGALLHAITERVAADETEDAEESVEGERRRGQPPPHVPLAARKMEPTIAQRRRWHAGRLREAGKAEEADAMEALAAAEPEK
jgi:tRNA pseudouridine38/39 synthase